MKTNLLLLLGIVILSCSPNKGTYSLKKNKDEKMAIINDSAKIKSIAGSIAKSWVPNQNDLNQVDTIFLNAINDGKFYFLDEPSLKALKERYRQYICYVNEKGEKIIHVNSFCEIPEIVSNRELKPLNWKKEMVDTADGGSCYWKMKINLTTNIYYEMMVNGES